MIRPNASSSGTPTFADWGDSGSAVVNDENQVVGLLFGMGSLTPGDLQAGWGFAWGYQELYDRFAAHGIDLIVPVGTLNQKKVVDGSAHAQDLGGIEAARGPAAMARTVEDDLQVTELGRSILALWLRHSSELNTLVNGNRRVGAQWLRLGGAELVQSALRSAYNPAVALPEAIDGRPVDDCLQAILNVFERYGSLPLKNDIRAYRHRLPAIGGRSYREVVRSLRVATDDDGRVSQS